MDKRGKNEKAKNNLAKGKKFTSDYQPSPEAKSKGKMARKTMREELIALLEAGKTQEKISVALIQEALNGNVKAFEVIRDTIGEKPSTDLNLNQFDLSPIKVEIIE